MELHFEQEEKIFKSVKKPIYVCHGEYEFLQKELARKIVDFLLPADEKDVGLQRFDGVDADALAGVINAASAPSLFAATQVLFIDNAQSFALKKKEEAEGKKGLADEKKYENHKLYEHFARLIEKPVAGVHLVMICRDELRAPAEKTSAGRSEKMLQRLYNSISKSGMLIKFPAMYDEGLAAWIIDRGRRRGLFLTDEQAESLLEWAGKDVRHLANEIEKMSVYVGDNRQLTMKEMRRLATSGEDVFVNHLADYMLKGKGKSALFMMDRSIEGGSHPVKIVAVLASRLRSLWQARYLLDRGYFKRLPKEYKYGKSMVIEETRRVSDADRSVLTSDKKSSILSKTPYAIYQLLVPARRLTLKQIEWALEYAMDVDRRLKGIKKPKHGSDEIMIQNYIVDVVAGIKEAGVPN
jgi:DNA polymerase III subunit delta